MMKKEVNAHQYFYQLDDNNKNLGKKRYNNIKTNSPNLSHQENNYFYNTKINHLILHGLSNNNKGQNLIQQQNPLFNSVYINYGLPVKNSNNVNSIYHKNEINNSLNKDSKNIIGLDYLTNRKNINRYSKSFLEDNSSNNNNFINNNFNEYNSNNRNKNDYNPFQVLNYLKKRKNINNNIFHLENKDINVNYSNEIYGYNNLSKSNILRNGIAQNKNKSTYIEGLNNKKNICIYNNNQNNINKNAKSSRYIEINTSQTSRKIPLKKEAVGNYHIKNPGIINSKKVINKSNKINKINIGKKGNFKSPENIGKNKTNFIPLKNMKNSSTNKISGINNSEVGLYKKNDLKTKSSINISNHILKKNNILNNNIKTSTINNINRCHLGNNKIYKDYHKANNLNNNELEEDVEKKINTQNDIYIKMNSKSNRYADINIKNAIKKRYESPKNNAFTDKKINIINNNNNYKYFTNSKKLDYIKINNTIEEFCDILEQFYYNSFKNCFNFFIQQLIIFSQQKNSNRAVVLRRLKGGKKMKFSNNLNLNTSRTNITNINNNKENKEINDPRKYDKSPTKFVELQNNIMPSMMKINQDSYIQMFNELFKRQNESIDDKKCRSPMIEKRKLEEEINLFTDSFNLENSEKKEKVFNKYKTNTNVNLYFPKKTNLKLNINSVNKNNNYGDKRINHIILHKPTFRSSLSSDHKKHNSNSKNYNNKIDNCADNNNIKKVDDDNLENTIYNDNKIFQKQKYIINNSPETYYYNDREISDKQEYDKIIKSQGGKNIILYTKPLLKNPITKESDFINNKTNNLNIINLKQNNRNIQPSKNNINTFHSHNILHINQNLSITPSNNSIQKSIFENLNYKEEIKSIFNKSNKYSEIIVKNVCTKDKRLHVFIKYVELGNNLIKRNKKFNRKLSSSHTDSITLRTQNYNHRSFSLVNNFINNENDFDNAILEKNRTYNFATEKKIFSYKDNQVNDNKEKEKNKLRNKKLTNIGEEESQSNQKITLNNSISSTEEKNSKNEDINNSIIYLINFLQNLLDDNKKLILFNFFKNLKKIKTNALLHTSIKNKVKNKSKNENIINSQRYNNKNIIEINNFNNYKNLNRSTDIKLKDEKKKNLKNELSKSLNTKITRNKNNDFNLSHIISKPHLKEENLLIDNKLNNKTIKDKLNKHHYNTSFNKNNIYNSTNNSIYLDKKDSLIEDSLKPKEQTINSKRDEINIEKEKQKQKIKEIKLAKLGKIFKNLEQENNIINAIKEQFLEWSNNNNFDLRKRDNRNLQQSENKKYGIKTFDMKFMFNNSLNEDNIQNIKENKGSEEFEENLNNFRIKLIVFSLKNYDKNGNKYESKNDKDNNDKDNSEENQINNKSLVIDDKYNNETTKEKDVDSLNKKEKENDEENEEEEDDDDEEEEEEKKNKK